MSGEWYILKFIGGSLRSNEGLIVYGLEEEHGSWHWVTAGTGEHTLTSLSSLDSTEGLLGLGDPRSWSNSSLGIYPSPSPSAGTSPTAYECLLKSPYMPQQPEHLPVSSTLILTSQLSKF
nr:unnamed protein product [Callosobruchus analis]